VFVTKSTNIYGVQHKKITGKLVYGGSDLANSATLAPQSPTDAREGNIEPIPLIPHHFRLLAKGDLKKFPWPWTIVEL
jgi:hypothetical protein